MGKSGYVNYLDGFRGFCCFFLIAYHWPMPLMSISFGWEVLQAFFTLSGYLIVRILLNDKNKFFYFKDYFPRYFYRRSFRIFPLYFGFIFFWFAVHHIAVFVENNFLIEQTSEVDRNFGFLLTYVYNFMGLFNHFRDVDPIGSSIFGHLWSLSLEEQFYLIAPFIVFFLNRKQLIYLFLAVVVLSPLIRYGGYWWLHSINPDDRWIGTNLYRMAPFQMDSFAAGGLLAVTGFKRIKKPVLVTLSFIAFVLCVYAFIRWYVVAFQDTSFQEIGGERKLEVWLIHNHQYIYIFTLVNMCVAFIVMCFERGIGLLPWLFENRLMKYFGKISYGIYVYHLPVLWFSLLFYSKYVPKWVLEKYPAVYEIAAWSIFMGITLALSHYSYKYFESYFLSWKAKLDKIKYNKVKGVK